MKIAIGLLSILAIVFLILFIRQKSITKAQIRRTENLKKEFEEAGADYWNELDTVERNVYEANARECIANLKTLTEQISLQQATLDDLRAKAKQGLDTEISELRATQLQLVQNDLALAREDARRQLEVEKAQIAQDKRDYELELNRVKAELSQFQEKRKAVNEAIRRERELNEKENFYSIDLTTDDIEDIEMLKGLVPRLRHRELIPKLIWDALVSRPTNEMIKRVVGAKVGGIYKITYAPTGESYIGRTSNFKDRWKAHIQNALGMDKIARSSLHVHMAQHNLNDYRFEILEECGKEVQSEREKFYIELYGTQTQLNMRIG